MKHPRSAVLRSASWAALLVAALALAACSQPAKTVAAPVVEPPAPPSPVAIAVPAPLPDQDLVTDPRAIAAAQRAFALFGRYDVGKPGWAGTDPPRVA